jgi:hypothetical protein
MPRVAPAARSAPPVRRLLGEYKDVPVHWREELAPAAASPAPPSSPRRRRRRSSRPAFDARIDRLRSHRVGAPP